MLPSSVESHTHVSLHVWCKHSQAEAMAASLKHWAIKSQANKEGFLIIDSMRSSEEKLEPALVVVFLSRVQARSERQESGSKANYFMQNTGLKGDLQR